MTEQEYLDVTNKTRIESALATLNYYHDADEDIKGVKEILHNKLNELNRKFNIEANNG